MFTVELYGLANPFDPVPKSAELLADLKQRFGNLGLAAARRISTSLLLLWGVRCSRSSPATRITSRF
jgi:hypothetical protein